jgi:5-methylcytosine-specific restriction endonuclease McrA
MKALFYAPQDDRGLLARVPKKGNHNRLIFKERYFLQKSYGRYKATVRRPDRQMPSITAELKNALEQKYSEGRDGKGTFIFIKDRHDNPGTTCCPYCGRGGVGTIDHYLPQAIFPLYSIFSQNLVPACQECQLIKGDRIQNVRRGRPIHPILDAVTLSQQLVIRWNFKGPTLMDASFEFDVLSVGRWSKRIHSQERNRFKRHWKFFNIQSRKDIDTSCHLALNDIRIRLEDDSMLCLDIKNNSSAMKNWLDSRIRSVAAYTDATTSPMLQEAMLRGFRSDLDLAIQLASMPLPAKAAARNRSAKLLERRQK